MKNTSAAPIKNQIPNATSELAVVIISLNSSANSIKDTSNYFYAALQHM